jgi:hypothetical protein
MDFYECQGVDSIIYYTQVHLEQMQKSIESGGSVAAISSLINHTHRYIDKIKAKKLHELHDMATLYMESQNYHQKFEEMRIEKEKIFIKEMVGKYGKMLGIGPQKLQALMDRNN